MNIIKENRYYAMRCDAMEEAAAEFHPMDFAVFRKNYPEQRLPYARFMQMIPFIGWIMSFLLLLEK